MSQPQGCMQDMTGKASDLLRKVPPCTCEYTQTGRAVGPGLGGGGRTGWQSRSL